MKNFYGYTIEDYPKAVRKLLRKFRKLKHEIPSQEIEKAIEKIERFLRVLERIAEIYKEENVKELVYDFTTNLYLAQLFAEFFRYKRVYKKFRKTLEESDKVICTFFRLVSEDLRTQETKKATISFKEVKEKFKKEKVGKKFITKIFDVISAIYILNRRKGKFVTFNEIKEFLKKAEKEGYIDWSDESSLKRVFQQLEKKKLVEIKLCFEKGRSNKAGEKCVKCYWVKVLDIGYEIYDEFKKVLFKNYHTLYLPNTLLDTLQKELEEKEIEKFKNLWCKRIKEKVKIEKIFYNLKSKFDNYSDLQILAVLYYMLSIHIFISADEKLFERLFIRGTTCTMKEFFSSSKRKNEVWIKIKNSLEEWLKYIHKHEKDKTFVKKVEKIFRKFSDKSFTPHQFLIFVFPLQELFKKKLLKF